MCLLELEIGKRVKVPVLIETAQTTDARNGGKYQKLVARDTDGQKVKMNSFLKPERFLSDKDIYESLNFLIISI